MKFAHVLSRVTGAPWLIMPDALEHINALLEARINGQVVPAPGENDAPAAPLTNVSRSAVIPISGVIGKRITAMEAMCGGVDVDAIDQAFMQANADSNIDRIVLHIDSPGGQVTGVAELAARMWDAKKKPMVAVTDTKLGSAAYWFAAMADEIWTTPTARVGSIGAALMVQEATGMPNADSSTRLRIFRSGADKLAGADAPLTEAQAKFLQEQVDYVGGLFRADVGMARPSIARESMTGNAYFGREALARGLVDRVVTNLSEALAAG